jgi:hypothetical protein
VAELRPLTDESGGTCDWGGCNEHAVAERHSPQHGWLPVCQRHTGPTSRPSPGRGTCGHCGSSYALTADGMLRAHNKGMVRCAGSGTAPDVPP